MFYIVFGILYYVVNYLHVSFSKLKLIPRLEKRELIYFLSITRNYVVCVRKDFLLLFGALVKLRIFLIVALSVHSI